MGASRYGVDEWLLEYAWNHRKFLCHPNEQSISSRVELELSTSVPTSALDGHRRLLRLFGLYKKIARYAAIASASLRYETLFPTNSCSSGAEGDERLVCT